MALGYIIRTKSAVEASIIMNAVRKQLSEKKLEDSIRYIDSQSRSSQNEGSSTIEIWDQVVDILNTLKNKNIYSFGSFSCMSLFTISRANHNKMGYR